MMNEFKIDFSRWISRQNALTNRSDGKFIRRYEARLRKRLAVLWKKQMNWVVENMESLPQFQTNASTPDDFVDGMPMQKEVAETIVASMRVSLAKGGATIVKKLKLGDFGVTFSLQNKEVIRFLENKLSHELSNYRGNIHKTTVDRISKILRDAAQSGESYSKTSKLIQKQAESGVFSQARGELIATREIGVAYEKGNDFPVRDFIGKNPDRRVLKLWRTVGDNRVTDECRANQAEGWINYSQEFSSGDEIAPRDSHPRCRCFTERKIEAPKK